MRPVRLVALDLSTAATAVAATHDKDGLPFLHTFTIPGTAKRPLHEQIAAIEYVVRRSVGWSPGGAVWVPDLVIVEGTFTRMSGSDYPLHALHANIKQFLWRRGIAYLDVSPATLKVWATGGGATSGVNKVTKDKVVAAVLASYGGVISINPRDDNQADAVALLTLGLHGYGQPIGETTTAQRRALKGIEWPALKGL